ncbi:hypothetical protein ACP0HM_24825 [Escherichia coli]
MDRWDNATILFVVILTRYALRWWPVYASCDEVPRALSVKCQAPE